MVWEVALKPVVWLQDKYVTSGQGQMAELAQQQANDIAYDPSAVTILEEAVTLGILPSFRSVSRSFHLLLWACVQHLSHSKV